MAFWDDVVSFFTGGGNKPQPRKSSPAPRTDNRRRDDTLPAWQGGSPRTMTSSRSNGGGSFDQPKPDTSRRLGDAVGHEDERSQKTTFWGTPVSEPMASGQGLTPTQDNTPTPDPAAEQAYANSEKFFQTQNEQAVDTSSPEAVAKRDATNLLGGYNNDFERLTDERNKQGALNWGGGFGSKELTSAEYFALSPQQRAAVDANTALVNAIAQDEAESGKPDAAYDKLVSDMFGQYGTSEQYAPRTVELLRELGIEDQNGDLDQYLNRSRLLTLDDIRAIGDDSLQGRRYDNARQFGEGSVSALSKALAAGQEILGRMQGLDSELYGEPTAQLGFNPANTRDADLQDFFNTIASRDSTLSRNDFSKALGYFEQTYGLTPEQMGSYFEQRLRANDLAPNDNYIPSDQFRKLYYQGGQ